MKTKTKLSLILSSIALGLGAFSALSAANAFEANGASQYDTASPTKNIDLNDCSEDEIKNYYSTTLGSLGENELKGSNLLKNLKTRLKLDQKYFSYDSAKTSIWKLYEIIDRDWVKSPASEIAGYNANTNKITGYSYLETVSAQNPGPYVHALYINRDDENLTTAWGDHDQSQWGINQEHIWAKSNGFDTKGGAGARGDPMHLWAGNGKVNGSYHSNYYFAYVDKNRDYSDAGKEYFNLEGNLKGYSKTLGNGDTNNVFEPQDSDKGDIARAIFYMVARYNYLSGSDSDGIDSNNPNLELVQNSDFKEKGYSSSTTSTGKMGVLTDLLAWHHADPVDEFEIHRNNLLFRNYTKNRNPFIDYPEWADYIWGTVNYNGSTYVSYDSTPSGYVDLNSDVIYGYKNASGDSLGISSTSESLMVDETVNLTATPSSNVPLTWETSNSEVASISSTSGSTITVTGVSAGNATITVTATINEKVYTKTCNVKVISNSGTIGLDTTISLSDYTEGYGDQGTSGTIKKSIVNTNDLTINYSGVNTQAEGGTKYNYAMYYTNYGYIYSSNCPTGYYPTNINVTFSSQTSVNGKIGISFSDEVLNERDSTVTGAVTKSGTFSSDNSDVNKLYWNISTSTAKVQILSIEVTYEAIPIQVTSITLDKHSASILIDEELQLTASVLPDDADDKSISWTTSDEEIASVSDEGLVTGLSKGTVTITAYASNGLSDSCEVEVTEISIIAFRFTSKGWNAVSGATIEGATESNNWESVNDGYAMKSEQGVQITTGTSGASAISPISYKNVSKVTLSYCTNADKGAGSVDIKVGSTSLTPASEITKTGGAALRTIEYTATSPLDGKITITVTCTTNSIYINGVLIELNDDTPAFNPTTDYEVFEKVTDVSDLRENDKILLIGMKGENDYLVMGSQDTYVRTANSISLTNDNTVANISEHNNYEVVTLTGSSNEWVLNVTGGYLYPASDSHHNLQTTETLDDNSKWTITINNGFANIICNGTYSNDQINMYYSGNTTPRFSCENHDSGSLLRNVMIFKSYEYEADQFGEAFLIDYTSGCMNDGYNQSGMKWSTANTAYTALTQRAKTILRETTADIDLEATWRAQAMARYDQIIRKYGTSTFTNFIDRVISNSVTNPRLNSTSSNQLIIILVVGSITILSVASFYIIRRRKEE